jgi:hypothetical protein
LNRFAVNYYSLNLQDAGNKFKADFARDNFSELHPREGAANLEAAQILESPSTYLTIEDRGGVARPLQQLAPDKWLSVAMKSGHMGVQEQKAVMAEAAVGIVSSEMNSRGVRGQQLATTLACLSQQSVQDCDSVMLDHLQNFPVGTSGQWGVTQNGSTKFSVSIDSATKKVFLKISRDVKFQHFLQNTRCEMATSESGAKYHITLEIDARGTAKYVDGMMSNLYAKSSA